MDKNPLSKGVISENFAGVGTVSSDMVNARARELALISGRAAADVSEADYEQARRELSGGKDIDHEEEVIESLPESMRWNPIPGSEGRLDPEPPSEDEDEEGRNESAQLVDEGVQEAEHDSMLRAEESAKKDEETGR